MSTNLTFEQRTQRDRLTFAILNDVAYYNHFHDSEIPEVEVKNWEARASSCNMSKAAISQTVEEVRQVLNLMSKLNKKRVA